MQGKAPRLSLGPVRDLSQDLRTKLVVHGCQKPLKRDLGGVASGGGGKGEPSAPKQGVARG